MLQALNEELRTTERITPQNLADHAITSLHLPESEHYLVKEFAVLLKSLDNKLQGFIVERPFEVVDSTLDYAVLGENVQDVVKALTNFVNKVVLDPSFAKSDQGRDIVNLVQLMINSYQAQYRISSYLVSERPSQQRTRECVKDSIEQDLLNRIIKREAAKSTLPKGLKDYFGISGQYVIPQLVPPPLFEQSFANQLDDRSIDLLSILYRASKEILGQALRFVHLRNPIDSSSPSRGTLSRTDNVLLVLERRQEALRSFVTASSSESRRDKFLVKVAQTIIDHADAYIAQARSDNPYLTEELNKRLYQITGNLVRLLDKDKNLATCFTACPNTMLTAIPGSYIGP